MAADQQSIPVKILGQEYVIACEPGEREQLRAAAHYANQKLLEIRDSNKVLGAERLLVLAVLNIANELLTANVANSHFEQSLSRVARMQQRIEGALVGTDPTPQPG
ncbi:MAG: cell division protein ZapA [Immundisolibacteraceae bacterium]|nr:cell division protein ZapA [Immundisolibacteraceae bacterium]